MLIKPVTLISPWSRHKDNAKNYPYWKELVDLLQKRNWVIIQVGVDGEEKICDDFRTNLTLDALERLALDVGHYIAIDNFFHHMAYHLGVKGVTIFGPSDPLIFGYPTQINILKSRQYLREDQFGFYKDWKWKHQKEGWYEAEEVLRRILEDGSRNEARRVSTVESA